MDKKAYSGLSKDTYIIPAYTVKRIEYIDTKPNYFRVQNHGNATIYCGTSHIPTQSDYDFMCVKGGMKMFAEPYYRRSLYIFNPSGNDINVVVLSFAAEFDPLTLALSEISIDVPTAIETDTNIASFKTSLPLGNNKIGKIEISEALPAGTNNIGNVGLSTPIPAGNNIIGTVKVQNSPLASDISTIKLYTANLETILEKLTGIERAKAIVDQVAIFEESSISTITTICNGGYCRLHMITNDGDTSLTLGLWGTSDTEYRNITLKAGESIEDFSFDGKIQVSGSNYSFRCIASYMS